MGNLTAQLEQNMEVVAELRNLNKLRPFLFILLLAEHLEKYFLIHNDDNHLKFVVNVYSINNDETMTFLRPSTAL